MIDLINVHSREYRAGARRGWWLGLLIPLGAIAILGLLTSPGRFAIRVLLFIIYDKLS